MTSPSSIQAFSQRAAELDRLDVVVENAGVLKVVFEVVPHMDSAESSVAVNVIGTFLLALGLLPVLKRSKERTGVVPRLVIVSSNAHYFVRPQISLQARL